MADEPAPEPPADPPPPAEEGEVPQPESAAEEPTADSPTGSERKMKPLARRLKPPKQLPSMQRSQFAKQVDSTKVSAPQYGFGTAPRFHATKAAFKQIVSKQHSMHAPGAAMDNPGPGSYKVESSVGKQSTSNLRSSANFAFGTEVRFALDNRREKMVSSLPAPGRYPGKSCVGIQVQSTKETGPSAGFGTSLRSSKASLSKGFEEDFFGLESPGPAEYNSKSGIGRQARSSQATAATHVFGTEPRPIDPLVTTYEEKRTGGIPGPGKYTLNSSIGQQVCSDKTTMPHFAFGTCDRDQAGVVSLDERRAHLKLYGKISPGPGIHKTAPGSVGLQPASTKRSSSQWTIGNEERFQPDKSTAMQAPGPGSYCV
mmetsp:Transcript_12925/g.15603  ORF Transcript_12925/g.15603 Transcript_12925/m.15603 type:complete len:371 (-) Transcript_12925:734-1846(-)|eukprot:CAMPEP_0197860346 /NCGR_PEP_ID=MMETSP1438-20131217/35619_1 /TAXON_ID=1461541 /ORGANISM="Pterosperma sp., Strain CCMP1384" /LENGTH=370 /DNA_ID=CAMNT_0043477161 /DNA_START=203 /DNA_END=1315 /DNA_ORIENTATION=-